MNPLIQPKNASPLILIALLLACLALSPRARAVVPAPDGGYPGQNTAEGQSALLHLAGGTFNTALGWASLGFNVTGNYNTAIGAGTLLANTEDQNTAIGAGALLSNTTGVFNTANGAFALFSNTTGFRNTANGINTLFDNTTGSFNTAIGNHALANNTTGSFNTAIGGGLSANTTGDDNVALGFAAGSSITGNGNVCIGVGLHGVAGVDDTTWIRNINTTNFPFIAGTNNYVTVRMSDGALGWTTVVSSRRYKEDIKPMDKASEALMALKPVTFRLKGELDPSHRPQWGLIAEEVEKVNPDLVTRDKEGKPYTVRYDAVNAMLLNEFLKEHRRVDKLESAVAEQEVAAAKQEARIAQQQQQIEALTAGLQKVSAQFELNKSAPQTVLNIH
jgi:uncharacterized coiled-coil protein SlyX